MNAEDQSFSSRMESLQFGVNHALHLAAEDGDIGKVRYLVENGADVNEKNESGETPLLWAARAGHVDVVQYLLMNGADVYVKNESGTTALHWAARAGHVDVVKCLVEKNAEVNARKSEITPLHWAAWAGHIDVAKYLVENGAEVDAKRKSGVTALHLADKQGHVDLVRCLVENGARVEAENEDEEVIAGGTQPVNNTKKPVENEEALVLDEVLTLQDKLRDAMSEIEKLKKANSEKQAENMTLKDENTKLYAEIMQVRSENLCNSIEMFKIKLGGKVHANDDEDVGVGEGESCNQEEPVELARFINPFNCEVSCSSCAVLFNLHMMGLDLCFQRFMMYLTCKIPGGKSVENVVGKRCSLSLTDFSKAGLLEDKDVFNVKITGECTIDDALRKAREKLESYPAVLAIEYEKNADGTQPVGHSVAIMPDGKYIDVQERRYWQPTPNSRISHIHVVNVKKSEITEWKRNCGLQNCKDGCIVGSTECSNDSLE